MTPTDTEIPVVVAYGLGVDSTAMLVEMSRLGRRPDLILFADTGNEKQETYDYLPIIQNWLSQVGFPPVIVVRRTVSRFKHWPPYDSLGTNCLTNGTLPSLAFGRKACSLKWKVVPQDKYCDEWRPAIACWVGGCRVRKLIGYDAGPRDRKRYAMATSEESEDPKYTYEYPLVEWGWDRDRCKAEIAAAGLPVPPKSACYFCPSTQPEELREFKKLYLRYIVVMEARAEPRLHTIKGLWRTGTKGTRGGNPRPGRMTDFIRSERLLPAGEIDQLIAYAPKDLRDLPGEFDNGFEIPEWHDFIEAFTPETGGDGELLPVLGNACDDCACS